MRLTPGKSLGDTTTAGADPLGAATAAGARAQPPVAAARTSASAAATPRVHAWPWPGSTKPASSPSRRASDASACAWIRAERGDPRRIDAGRDAVGRDRVADEQGVVTGQVERGAPGRMAGQQDDPGRARHVQRGAVTERRHLGDPGDAQQRRGSPRTTMNPSSGESLTGPRPFDGLGTSPRARRRVELVDEDRRPSFATDPLGEPDVIRMAVGQDDRTDVVERAPHRGQLRRQVAPVRRRAGVDDRHLARRSRPGTS